MYLGKMSDKDEYRYYLPQIGRKRVQLSENPMDEKLKAEVDKLTHYPPILRHGSDDESTMPEGTFILISNPGFKVINLQIEIYRVLVISDIVGDNTDGGYRKNPFTFIIVGESDDIPIIDAFAYQYIVNRREMDDYLSSLFTYDPVANGLRFALKHVIEKMKSISSTGSIAFDRETVVPLIILAQDFELHHIVKTLKLEGGTIGCVYKMNGQLVQGRPPLLISSEDIIDDERNMGKEKSPDVKQEETVKMGQSDANHGKEEGEEGNVDIDDADNRERGGCKKNCKEMVFDFFKFVNSWPAKYKLTMAIIFVVVFLLGALILGHNDCSIVK